MARVDSSPDEILTAFINRIISKVGDATADSCFISDDPDEIPAANPSDWIYVVSMSPTGSFHEGNMVGGGRNQITVETKLILTVHSTAQNDEPGHAVRMFTDPTRGLLPKLGVCLWALAIEELTNPAGDNILSHPLHPDQYHWMRKDRTQSNIQQGFDVEFDWDLEKYNSE